MLLQFAVRISGISILIRRWINVHIIQAADMGIKHKSRER